MIVFNNFLSKHRVLIPELYNFQKLISTTHVIIDVVTKSFENIKNLFIGIFFIDLKKAFDAVSHKIWLTKFCQPNYGIRGPALLLIKSFFERQQFVTF